jgi:ABC-type branched-subunit amino acid transport system substrate-binding protein
LQFENKYKARWGEIQSYSAYYAYDLMYFIRDIIEKNGGKLDKTENIIKIINNGVFNLMTGSYSFKDGDAHPPVALGKYSKEMKLEEILNE